MKTHAVLLTLFLSFFLALYLPAQKREMRAVWIATVENIDWPSTPFLSSEQQKKELTALLDAAKECRLNTVVLQIRPAADAFYDSNREPWSYWLTGMQGCPPEPFYDPLKFAIGECRKRGLDIHVWLNPYRAIRDTSKKNISPSHITRTHHEWFVTYGSTVYFDPALPEVRNYVAEIVGDIVRRYDIDAVHMDDYFYPYRIAGKSFPDDSSFNIFRGNYPPERKDDWRRNNVNLIIQQIRDTIQFIKPYVEFGISPFGVWRNADKDSSGSATRAGQTNYDDLFADVLKWQKEGWIDYVVPQLYWQIGMKVADYAVLARWWNEHAYGCPLYIGHALYRINRRSDIKAWRSSDEIIRQINLNRSLPAIKGSFLYSGKFLISNPVRLKQNLTKKAFAGYAIPPENIRIQPVISGAPQNAGIVRDKRYYRLNWIGPDNAKSYIIYKTPVNNKKPSVIIEITANTAIAIRKNRSTNTKHYVYAVSSLSHTNTESEAVNFK